LAAANAHLGTRRTEPPQGCVSLPIVDGDWIKAPALSFAVAAFGILLPELVTRDKNSPDHISAQQMGNYEREGGPSRAPHPRRADI
jgi:hypothetical protein